MTLSTPRDNDSLVIYLIIFSDIGLSVLHDIDPCHGHHRHRSLLVRVKRHHGCQPVQGEDLVALKLPGDPLDRETNGKFLDFARITFCIPFQIQHVYTPSFNQNSGPHVDLI